MGVGGNKGGWEKKREWGKIRGGGRKEGGNIKGRWGGKKGRNAGWGAWEKNQKWGGHP